MIAAVRVGGRGPRTGYSRDAFGAGWLDVDRNGCRTRDDILARDLAGVTRDGRCTVLAGTLADPYTGRTVPFGKADPEAVQIDHVVPLALAWGLGAPGWAPRKRIAFGNDPANLLAVDGDTNAAKSDSAPDAWLPPNKAYRCTYAIRFIRVVAAYDLRITRSMRDTVLRLVDGCQRVQGAPASLAAFGPSVWRAAGRFAVPGLPDPLAPAGPGGGSSSGSAAPLGSACPPTAPIKGNDSSSGELIYHVPGGDYYDVTVPERCFATEEAAVAVGFRRSMR